MMGFTQMPKPNDHIIPLLSKRYLQKTTSATVSRVMHHVLKETAKMNVEKEASKKVVKQQAKKKEDLNA
ncbi:MAG: hypothetical protein ABII18_05850 [bacterium]